MKKKLSLILVSIMLIVTCCLGLVSCSTPEENTTQPATATAFGLLGEPAVTASQTKGLTYGLDLQTLYQDATKTEGNNGYGYPQAVVIVNSNFLAQHEDVVARFMAAMVENQTYINVDANKAGITNILQNNAYGLKSASAFPVPAISKCGIKVSNTQETQTETIELLKTIGMKNVDNNFFASCKNDKEGALSTDTLKIAVPDGAPALSVAKIVEDGINGIQNLSLDINKPPLIIAAINSQKVDIAILPSNVAYAQYNKAKATEGAVPYKMVASATYGNLHIVANGTVNTLDDLKGKVIYSIGKNAIPHKVFEKVCKANNIELNIINDAKTDTLVADKINIIFVADGPSVIGAIKAYK